MTLESQNIEWKRSWRDEHLKCICGFANGRGGVLEIGKDDRGEVIGVKEAPCLLEEIPNKAQSLLGIVRYQLDKLKRLGRLRRVGPDRGGRWVVVDGFDVAGDGEKDGCAEDHRGAGGAPPEDDLKTTRKDGHLPERNQKASRKPPEPLPLPDRILTLLRQNPSASRREIAATLDTTESTVRYRLDKLRAAGKIARVGPDKGGHWKVLDDSATEPDPSPPHYPGNPR